MSQRFVRCPHCRLPHDGDQVFCSTTGKPIRGPSRQAREQAAQAAAAVRVDAPAPSPPSSRRLSPLRLLGKTIGNKYVVRKAIGEGGMGTVFEAEHLALGRAVAVKVLHATQVANSDSIRRFQQEARAAAAIGHPNICGVIDLGTLDDGSPYIVMERLVGETLADRIASEAGMAFEDVIDVLVQVLSGLVAAHEQRIVHRDIKPENIFLTKRVGCPPLVKVLDFGVSKMTGSMLGGMPQEDLDLTRTGMVMGTPYYMAPEQARGERDLDARVDLYACGVILYEALTGKRPFAASNYNALLLQIQAATPHPALALRPALPAAYGPVIEKAMARDRRDRYATAAAFQQDLQALRDLPRPGRPSAASASVAVAVAPEVPSRSKQAEAPSSSVEIPVVFTDETSGGLFAVDPTEVHVRAPDSSREGRSAAQIDASDADPTQLMAAGKPRRS
jgi:eukaryotic-like serine/threonine-protein kinase